MTRRDYLSVDSKLREQIGQWSKYFILVNLIIPCLVLIGWWSDIEFLRQPLPDSAPMNPVTAVTFILSSASFFLIKKNKRDLTQVIGYILALLVMLIGCLKIAPFIFGYGIDVDRLLFSEKMKAEISYDVSPLMAPNSAFNFILAGIALLILNYEGRKGRVYSQHIAVIIAFVGLFSIVGYIYRVEAYAGILDYIPMAPLTAINFIPLSLAILGAYPEKGLMKDFSGPYAGSITSRLFVPVTVIIPVLLGFMRLYAAWNWGLPLELGADILILSIIITFLFIIRYNTKLLNKRDIERADAEAKFKGLLDSAPDAIVIVNENGIIELINQQTEKLFGYRKDELVGKPVELLMPEEYHSIHINNRSRYFKEPKVRPMGEGLELYGVRNGGDRFPVEVSLSPMWTEKDTLVSASVRDITERKKAEDQIKQTNHFLDTILENIPNMIFVKEAKELRFVRFNKAGEQLLGYSRNDLLGKNDYDFFPKEQADFFTSKDRVVISKGELLDIPEEQINTADGERLLHTRKITIKDEEGKPVYLLGISEDITEQKKAQEQIVNLNSELRMNVEQLETLNKELEAFTYSVSHDLRAPLRIIDGYVGILTSDYKDKLDADAHRSLEVIQNNARKMGQLIDDLLNLSRLGRKELLVRHVNMKELVEKVIQEQFEFNASDHIEINTTDLLPAYCDSHLIHHVWTNLVSNAIKYSGTKDKSTIEIGSYKEGDEIVYFVKDNGVGFDMHYADKLFGIFQRLHKMSEFEGTGVGLAIVHRIVAKHKGRVWAQAEEGKGATFYFSLPAV